MSSRAVLALAGLAMLAACASQTPVGSGATPAGAAAPTGVAAATGAAAATPEQRAIQKYARNHGYKPMAHKGNTVWCRSDKPIGSTLEHTVCISESTLANLQRQAELDREDFQRRSTACAGMACSAN